MKERQVKYRACLIIMIVFLLSALTGCEFKKTKNEKLKDIDYTVCDESRLPHELVDLIFGL